ncbi:MAG: hypothetical protein ACOCZK_03400 [Planctomycetota bacterium]
MHTPRVRAGLAMLRAVIGTAIGILFLALPLVIWGRPELELHLAGRVGEPEPIAFYHLDTQRGWIALDFFLRERVGADHRLEADLAIVPPGDLPPTVLPVAKLVPRSNQTGSQPLHAVTRVPAGTDLHTLCPPGSQLRLRLSFREEPVLVFGGTIAGPSGPLRDLSQAEQPRAASFP